MALSYDRKKELAAIELPAAQEATRIALEYMATTGLTQVLFAKHAGIGRTTLQMLFLGRYHRISGTNKNVIAKIMAFIDANPAIAPDAERGRFYETENVVTLRQWFQYTLNNREICCVYGGPGSQKTFVAEELVTELNRAEIGKNGSGARAYYVYCSQNISPLDLVRKVMTAAGMPSCARMQTNLASLRLNLRNRKAVFLFDEAQHLSLDCLEIVRELNDLAPKFGVMLLGSHKLKSFFAARAAELEQWNSRIEIVVELPGISHARAGEIVQAELGSTATITAAKLQRLLEDCTVPDIYSGKRQATYLSARKLFKSIKNIKRAAQEAA